LGLELNGLNQVPVYGVLYEISGNVENKYVQNSGMQISWKVIAWKTKM